MSKFTQMKMYKKIVSLVLVVACVMSTIGMPPMKTKAEDQVDLSIPTTGTETTTGTLGWGNNGTGYTMTNHTPSGVKFTVAKNTSAYVGVSTQITGARYKISNGFRLEFTDFESDDDNYSLALLLGYRSNNGKMMHTNPGYAFVYGHDGSFAILKTTTAGTLTNVITSTSGLTPLSEVETMSLYVKEVSGTTGTTDWKVIINNGEFEYTISDVTNAETGAFVDGAAGYHNQCHFGMYMFSDFTANADNTLTGLTTASRAAETSFVLKRCYYSDATGAHNNTEKNITTTSLPARFAIPYTPVESVSMNRSEAVIEQESTVSLSATVLPAEANDSGIIWTSSNDQIASVDQNGTVTGVASGDAIITATTAYGKRAMCHVTVYEEGAKPSYIPTTGTETTTGTLGWGQNNGTGYTMTNHTPSGVKFTVAKDTAAHVGVSTQKSGTRYKISNGFRLEFTDFESDDDNYSLALLLGYRSNNGKMMYTNPGYAFVYGHDGSFAILKITTAGTLTNVIASTSGLTPLSEIDTMSLYVKEVSGSTGNYDWKVIVNNGEFEYTISDVTNAETGAFVEGASSYHNDCHFGMHMFSDFTANADNTLTGLSTTKRAAETSFVLSRCYYTDSTGAHNKEITTTTLPKWFAIPYAPVDSVTLNQPTVSVERKGTVSLSATVSPATANDSGIIWSSSNNKIATVDQNGIVTGLCRGQATITATTIYGKSVSCPVTVYEAKIETGNGQVLINAGEQLPINDYAYSQDANHDGVYITGWKLNGEALTDLTYYSNNAGEYTAEYVNLDMLHIHAQKNNELDKVYRFIGSVDAPIDYKESGFIISKASDAKIGDNGVHQWSNTDTYYTGIVLGDDRIVAGDTDLFDANIYGDDIVNNKLFIRAFKFNNVSEENPYYVRAYVKLADDTVVYGKTITFMGDVRFE